MDLAPIITILIAEYVGDFLLQDREMALNKSNNIDYLFLHIFYIFSSLLIGLSLLSVFYLVEISSVFKFVASYCFIHAVQDWFIWNIYKAITKRKIERQIEYEMLEKGVHGGDLFDNVLQRRLDDFKTNKEYAEDKMFYDFIGLDRLLHTITLIALFSVFFYL